MDKIFLRNYTVIATHGYYKEEHHKTQRFVVTIEVTHDLAPAGTSDDIGQTLNYEHLRKTAYNVLMKSPHNLLESLAEEIAQAVLVYMSGGSVQVEIAKPDVWNDCVPGVVIVRGK